MATWQKFPPFPAVLRKATLSRIVFLKSLYEIDVRQGVSPRFERPEWVLLRIQGSHHNLRQVGQYRAPVCTNPGQSASQDRIATTSAERRYYPNRTSHESSDEVTLQHASPLTLFPGFRLSQQAGSDAQKGHAGRSTPLVRMPRAPRGPLSSPHSQGNLRQLLLVPLRGGAL